MGAEIMNLMHVTQHDFNERAISWHAPQYGYVKVNTDSAHNGLTGGSYCGRVVATTKMFESSSLLLI